MIHVGRVAVDDQAPRIVHRGLERWERLLRGEEADRIAKWALERRGGYGLDVRAVRALERWVDRVWLSSHGGVSPVGVGAGAALTYTDVFQGDATLLAWHRGDLGATVPAGITGWAAQYGGSTFDWATTGGTSAQPTYAANNASLFGRSTITGDGLDDYMVLGSWNPPAPSTTPMFIRVNFQPITWTTAKFLWCGSSTARLHLRQSGTSPLMNAGDVSGSSASISAAIGSWYRAWVYYSGSAADDVRIGSVSGATGASFGASDQSALGLFARSAAPLANFGNYAVGDFLLAAALPSALKLALLDGIDARFYNAIPIAG